MSACTSEYETVALLILLVPLSIVIGTVAAAFASQGRQGGAFIMGSVGFVILMTGFITAWSAITQHWQLSWLNTAANLVLFLCAVAPLPYFMYDAKSVGNWRARLHGRIGLAVLTLFLCMCIAAAWSARHCTSAGYTASAAAITRVIPAPN